MKEASATRALLADEEIKMGIEGNIKNELLQNEIDAAEYKAWWKSKK